MAVKVKRVKRVCVVTGTRAEYGLLKPIMEEIQRAKLELCLVVAGMHLCHEFGNTFQEVERGGFKVDARVDMILSGDTSAAMAKSIGIGIYGMAQALEGLNPDAVLVLGDRIEAFAGAVSGAGLNRMVAHVHGGEKTRGGLDESMRHAITKFAHFHFAATEKSRERIIRMGEGPEFVYTVGAPGLDTVLNTRLLGRAELECRLGFSLKKPLVMAVQHSVSSAPDDAPLQARETLEALKAIRYQTIMIYPNVDAGGRRMIDVIKLYQGEPWLHVFPSLDHITFLSLLKTAAVLVGNSSSGITEAPSFRLPVVNIGTRQDGRERSTNIIDVPHERSAIQEAIQTALTDAGFRSQVQFCINPYGDGKASQRIVEILRSVELGPMLLQKQIAY